MRLVQYNNSAFTVRFEYPEKWDAQTLDGVNLTITDTSGNELLAATAATLYGGTTLNAAESVGDSTVELAVGASAFSPGDRFQIAAGNSGPTEDCEVQSYNSSTRVATLKRELLYDHASGAAVKGLWCTYDLDTSTVATWTKGLQLLFDWAPQNVDNFPARERGEVATSAFEPSDFIARFKVLYPEAYDARPRDIEDLYEESVRQLRTELLSRGLLMDRIQDQEMLTPALVALARYLDSLPNGDSDDSRKSAFQEYQRQISIISAMPIWVDTNQDKVEADEEIDNYSDWQLLNSENGI